jgi:hypothetical protein
MHRSKHIAAVATELSDEQKYPQGGGLADRPVDGITPPLTYRDASLRMCPREGADEASDC